MVSERRNLIITGHARHGKDTVCEFLRDHYGYAFESSSRFVAAFAVEPWLAKRGIIYHTFSEMYADRVNHRAEWKKAISDYNTPDPARLGKELFGAGNNIYCGLRDVRELQALRKIVSPTNNFKLQPLILATIWVDASKRCPPEGEDSCTITQAHCDYTLNNNGSLEDLPREINRMMVMKGLITHGAHI